LPHLSSIEKAGIPSVFIMFEDQYECWKQACRVNGMSPLRVVFGPLLAWTRTNETKSNDDDKPTP